MSYPYTRSQQPQSAAHPGGRLRFALHVTDVWPVGSPTVSFRCWQEVHGLCSRAHRPGSSVLERRLSQSPHQSFLLSSEKLAHRHSLQAGRIDQDRRLKHCGGVAESACAALADRRQRPPIEPAEAVSAGERSSPDDHKSEQSDDALFPESFESLFRLN